MVRERTGCSTCDIIGEEGVVITGECGDIGGVSNDEVTGDKGDDTEKKEENNSVVTVKPTEHFHPKAWFFVFKSISRSEACRKKYGCKCCPDMFTSIRLDDFVGNDIIYDDHDGDEESNESLQVSTKQGNDEAPDENLSKVEEETFDFLTIGSVS